jgi:hypothetical protein
MKSFIATFNSRRRNDYLVQTRIDDLCPDADNILFYFGGLPRKSELRDPSKSELGPQGTDCKAASSTPP